MKNTDWDVTQQEHSYLFFCLSLFQCFSLCSLKPKQVRPTVYVYNGIMLLVQTNE